MKGLATIVAVTFLFAGQLSGADLMIAPVSGSANASLDSERQLVLSVRPSRGDAWSRLALRTTGDASRWKELALLNRMGENLMSDRSVRVPFSLLRDELKLEVVEALFPKDRSTRLGWIHVVELGGVEEGESLWRIAEWFTGDGANYVHIRAANPSQPLSTRRGNEILIPNRILSPVFLGDGADDWIRVAEDPRQAKFVGSEETRHADLGSMSLTEPVRLDYETNTSRPYAIYRLQKGEALYSSVVIRFTGRVYSHDVYEVVDELVKFNGIGDVSKLPIGYQVRIPMELLTPEHRSPDDPQRIEWEHSRRERARVARRVEARDLEGVHVILDPGHGGRDVGTTHGGIWESTYVYDVVSRLKRVLEKNTAARVSVTTKSATLGYGVPESDEISGRNDHVVLTSPNYDLSDPVVGVNLRWYLANSLFRRTLEKANEEEKVLFISIHADSLHPSLRGAMAYIPGQKYVQGTYTKKDAIYLARAEVKENPSVTLTEEDALRAEGLSYELAKSIIGAFSQEGLDVHPFEPVRSHVVRNRKEWVPAVIRYNRVPTRLLLEICNIGNEDDRGLLKTRKFREQVAETIHDGIVAFFAQRASSDTSSAVAAASR